MKIKIFTWIFLTLLIFTAAYSKEVALVVKNANSLDYSHEARIRGILQKMGFQVSLIDKNSVNVDYSKYALIVIAGRPGDASYAGMLDTFVAEIPVNNYPSIVIDSAYPDDFGWIEPGAIGTIFSFAPKYIRVDNAHPIFKGYEIGDTIRVHVVDGKSMLDIEVQRSALNPIASYQDSYGTSVISVADAGKTLFKGKQTQARVVFFGITNSAYWTDEVVTLFENSVWWVLADFDNDGVLDHVDNCKAISNPSQADSDLDRIGDACDLCPSENSKGYDKNNDGCIDDSDLDGINDKNDNCPRNYNPDQKDSDGDGIGDKCNILPGSSVYFDIDSDGVNEYALNENNISEDGYETYKDPNFNTYATKIDGDNDGFTDFLIRLDSGDYKYWDPDDRIVTNVLVMGQDYYIDSNGDGFSDKIWNQKTGIYGIAERDVDSDGKKEIAKDTDNDGSFDYYIDPDNSTFLYKKVDGDNDGKNDFIIGLTSTSKPIKYWDPDNNILTSISEATGALGKYYLVDIGNNKFERILGDNLVPLPDITIDAVSATFATINEGERFQGYFVVKNKGGYIAENFTLSYPGGSRNITLGPGESETISFVQDGLKPGEHTLFISADSGNIILESDESNNHASMTVKVIGKIVDYGGGVSEKRIAELRGFPEQVVIKRGEAKKISGQFFTNMSYDIINITLSITGEGFKSEWASINPVVIERMESGKTANIDITFSIPREAQVYTYPLTLNAISVRNGVRREYFTEINLLVTGEEIPPTTTTTIPEEKKPEKEKNPFSGIFAFVKTNLPGIVLGILVAILLVLIIIFRDKLPRIQFETKKR